MKANKDYEVKTGLSEPHYKAMLEVIQSKGMTQSGYMRHLILRDIFESQDLVSQMNIIMNRAKSGN